MRIIAVSALAISLLLTALVSQSAPRASSPAPAGAPIDTNAMQSAIDIESLPEQQASDLF